ncbi:divalent-cation tolerance protein CutA [bacterium]
MDYCVVLVTAKDNNEAQDIAKQILEKRFAACVNIVPAVTSLYWWENKITNDSESLMVIKTTKDNVLILIDFVQEIHSYSVPEIISLPIEAGSAEYLNWIDKNVKK